MQFGFHCRSPRPLRARPLALMTLALPAVAAGVAPGTTFGAGVEAPISCVHISANVARYCGGAAAHLDAFSGVVFRNGYCARKTVGGVRLLQVRLGAKSLDGSAGNAGLPYFSLGIADSRGGESSGNLIAYRSSRRWFGRVVSYSAADGGGHFVARGVAGFHGRTAGWFRC